MLASSGFSRSIPAVVLDASVAVATLDGNELAKSALNDALNQSAVLLVPAHFWSEVANGLLFSARTTVQAGKQLLSLAELGLSVADRGTFGATDAIDLARTHRLTAYDAIYLQLALDIEGDLLTLDRQLAKAALAEGVTVRP